MHPPPTDMHYACLLRYPTDKSAPPIELQPPGITVGRDPSNTLQLSHKSVSRFHAKVEFTDGQYVLSDLNSSNGTYINKIRIEKAPLEHNDKVFFGSRGFIFLLEPAVSDSTQDARTLAGGGPININDAELDLSEVLENNVHVAVNKFLAPPLSGKKLAQHSILAYQRLSHLYQLSEILRSAKDTDTILARGIGLILQALPSAKCAVVLMRNEDTHAYDVKSIRFGNRESDPEPVSLNRNVLEKVVEEEVALVGGTEAPDSASTATAFICVPFFEGDNVMGALHVVAEDRAEPFTEHDMEFTAAVANEMARSIENCRPPFETGRSDREPAADAMNTPLARYIEKVLSTHRNAIDTVDHHLRNAEDSALRDDWLALYDGLERLAHLTADILAYGDGDACPGQWFDVNSSIRAGCALFEENLAAEGIALELDLAADLPEWHLQESLLQKALIHLVFNARSALQEKDDGRITISTRVDEQRCLVISVADNGTAFEPQADTNRPEGGDPAKGISGAGLRLSIIQKFAELSGGRLRVESQAGSGATFSLVLPQNPAEAQTEI